METNFLKLYMDANITLAKTLVIKSHTNIDTINDFIKLKYGTSAVDSYDPRSWKYYLNIAGEYHPTDVPMMVTSLDTLEDIVFSKQTLAIHTATRKAYAYGTRYYYSLVERYPDQEHLILSIITPCDLETAIAADEGTILSYPQHLVEPQELTLMDELEGFIKRYQVRWDVKAFRISNSLYTTAQQSLLYLTIVPKLLNLRLKRCRTNEAHSFHIREYLASHGRLDRYLPYMTLKQSLFLYRNIRFIERNSGSVEQFRMLVDHLLSERRIPLNELSIRQLSTFDEAYYNDITVRRKALNPQFNVPERDYFTLPQLFTKEIPLTYGNDKYYKADAERTIAQLRHSDSSVIQTKDLESSMVDYNDSLPDTLAVVLLREWAHLSQTGFYQAIVNFKDPKTLTARSLTADDAFVYMVYISLMSIGVHPVTIPTYVNLKQRRLTLPTVAELLSTTENDRLTAVATDLLDRQPVIEKLYSIDGFFQLGYTLHQESVRHWFLQSNTHDLYRRGYVSNMVYSLYEDSCLPLVSGNTPIATWLTAKNLPTYNYDYAQANELIKEIFERSTGLTVDNTRVLKNIQNALISALSELSSYSIQFMREINASRIVPVGWPAQRIGHVMASQHTTRYAPANVTMIAATGSVRHTITINPCVEHNFSAPRIHQQAAHRIDTKSNVLQYRRHHHRLDCYFTGPRITVPNSPIFIGYDHYIALTPEQKQSLISIYP